MELQSTKSITKYKSSEKKKKKDKIWCHSKISKPFKEKRGKFVKAYGYQVSYLRTLYSITFETRRNYYRPCKMSMDVKNNYQHIIKFN